MIKECKDYGGAVDGKFMEVHLGVIMPSQDISSIRLEEYELKIGVRHLKTPDAK